MARRKERDVGLAGDVRKLAERKEGAEQLLVRGKLPRGGKR